MAPKKKTLTPTGAEATLTVRKTIFNQEETSEEKIQIRPFVENARVGKVRVNLGRTINLGNFESARVDVSFEVPGYVEEMVDLYRGTMEWVGQILSEEVRRIEGSLNVPATQLPDPPGDDIPDIEQLLLT